MTPSRQSVTSTELEDVRVVELGPGIAGAFAARALGDFGARVTKVEPRSGDPLRGPDLPAALGTALFEYLNWNKTSRAFDLEDRMQRPELRRLVADADIVVTSLTPAAAARAGLSSRDIAGWNPSAVVVSVTGFGSEGPKADHAFTDLVLQASGGVMSISGATTREPLRRGLRQSLYYGGLNAAYASLAGLYAARHSGEGVEIDLSLRECVAAEMIMNQALYAFLGVLQSRPPPGTDPFGGYPLACADGHVTVQASTAAPMSRIAEWFDDPELARPEYASKEGRTARSDELMQRISPRLAEARARDFFVDANERGYIVGFVQGAEELLGCEHLAQRGGLQDFPDLLDRHGQPLRFPASLGRLSGWSRKRPATRAPELAEEGPDNPPPPSPRVRHEGIPAFDRPFTDLRVVDLSQVFAGPYIGALLSDLGMDVIKVEAPHRLDQARTDYGGYFDNVPGEDPWNRTSTFQVINRGKRSISLDLKTERGKQLLLDLVESADVVIENFSPRVLPRLGLAYEHLREVNPGLVMVSNSGFGATGPWSAFRAQGTTLEATMGACRYTGYADSPPMKAGQSYPDFLAAWSGMVAVLAALHGRRRTGRGQWIDLGMYELGISVMPEALLAQQLTGEDLPRTGNLEPGVLTSGVAACRGTDAWLAYSILDAEQLPRVLEAIAPTGRPADPDDPEAVTAALEQWAAGQDAATAATHLQQQGIAAAPVMDAEDLLLDEQLRHRRFYELVDVPGMGPRPIIGRPFRWRGGGQDVRVRGRAPRFAEHTQEVLQGLAGLSEADLTDAIDTGAVALAPRDPRPAHPHEYGPMLANGSIRSVGGDYHAVVDRAMMHWAESVDASSAPRVHDREGAR